MKDVWFHFEFIGFDINFDENPTTNNFAHFVICMFDDVEILKDVDC